MTQGDVWQEVYLSVADQLAHLDDVDGGYWFDRLVAILGAGTSTGSSVYKNHIECFSHIGPLTYERAYSVSAVTTMAMASRWMRRLSVHNPTMDRSRAWAALATDVLRLFDQENEDRYDESWWLDVQFNYDQDMLEDPDKVGGGFGVELQLVSAVCAREFGGVLNWYPSSPPIPVRSLYEAHLAGWEAPVAMKWTDLERVLTLSSDFLAAEGAMYAVFKSLTETRK